MIIFTYIKKVQSVTKELCFLSSKQSLIHMIDILKVVLLSSY